jgi:type I restriction enzyme S subunit
MFKFCDLIEEVSEFNTDLKYGLEDIIGVTIEKGLIPTVANLTQTALDKFYIVRPNTFIYNPRTHGVRLGMGFNETDNVYITSWNNVAFKVKDSAKEIVLPKYLWLYFLRPDWDRLSNFLAWGSSTIVFAWKDFLDIEISLPSIEKQREIVAEYNTLATRIETNKKLIATLEQTAGALYIEHIEKKRQKKCLLKDLCGFQEGYVNPSQECPEYFGGNVKWLRANDVNGSFIFETSRTLTKLGFESAGASALLFEPQTLVITKSGTIGRLGILCDYMCGNRAVINIKPFEKLHLPFIFFYLKNKYNDLVDMAVGSAQANLYVPVLAALEVYLPDDETMLKYCADAGIILNAIKNKAKDCILLEQMQTLLLSKMGA